MRNEKENNLKIGQENRTFGPYSVRKKILALALFLSVLFILSGTNVFAEDNNEALKAAPGIPQDQEKVQVIYSIKYLEKDTEASLYNEIKKISFSNQEETEEAISIDGYKLVSDKEQSIFLEEGNKNEIVFYYVKEEFVSELAKEKEPYINKINDFKNMGRTEKEKFIAKINRAENRDEIALVFYEAKNRDLSLKAQVKYIVKFIDIETYRELSSSYTKLGFAYDEYIEKAPFFKGYELSSEPTQTLILDKDNTQTIIFYYKKLDLSKEKAEGLKKLGQFGFISEEFKAEFKDRINQASSVEELEEILQDAERINLNSVKQVIYEVRHVNMKSGEVLKSYKKIDFQGVIVSETALEFEDLGLVSPKEQSIILDPKKENIIEFKYKEYDDPNIPLKDFLKEKLSYEYPLVYRNTDFTGNPDGLREYLMRKIHNGDLYAKFIATKEDQEKAYWDLFNKSTLVGNVRFARNWTDPKDTGDRTKPIEFTIGFRYVDTKEDMKIAENMMYDFVQKNIRDDMSDLKKIQIIHDYILNKAEAAITKDKVSLRQLPSGRPTNSSVALMIEGKAVCEGYAMAFNRMAEMAGIESLWIGGRYTPEWYFKYYHVSVDEYNKRFENILDKDVFDRGLNHSWNLVKLNNKWYHVDTYHDDFFATNSPGMKQEYLRFLKSDRFMIYNAGRYWNFKYAPEAKEDYFGSFDFITEFVE